MTHPLVFPPGRCLAEWWGQVASFEPRVCWFAYLFFHQVEARVRILANAPLDRLHRLILRALEMQSAQTPETFWPALDQRLYLGEPALRQIMRGLCETRLVDKNPASIFTLSQLGNEALATGEFPSERILRRTFAFVERLDIDGKRLDSPHYLAMQSSRGEAWEIKDEYQFDPAWLQECIEQSAAWKRDFNFPADVLELLRTVDADSWDNVIVDRPECVPLALVETKQQQLLGFGIHRETWKLLASAPMVTVGPAWPRVFPVLTHEASADWQLSAWRMLARERGISDADAAACTVSAGENSLHITAPAKPGDAVRRLRNESTKGQTWTLAGEGAIRKLTRVLFNS